MAYIDNILISLNLPIKNLSLDQGLQALNSLTNNGIDVVDKNILRDLVNRVSADAPGSVTVLYSGEVNADVGLRPLSIINAMKNNGDDIRVIMDSPAVHFLSHDLFEQALANSLGVQSHDLINKSTEANKFLEGPYYFDGYENNPVTPFHWPAVEALITPTQAILFTSFEFLVSTVQDHRSHSEFYASSLSIKSLNDSNIIHIHSETEVPQDINELIAEVLDIYEKEIMGRWVVTTQLYYNFGVDMPKGLKTNN